MLSDLQIHREKQDDLSASMMLFMARGGTIQEVPGFEFKPMPARRDRLPGSTTPASVISSIRSARIAAARESALTMTVGQAAKATGMSITSLRKYANEFGFTFKKSQKQIDDETMVAVFRTYIAEGRSRSQAAIDMGIGPDKIRRLTNEFLLEWPSHRNDPNKNRRDE